MDASAPLRTASHAAATSTGRRGTTGLSQASRPAQRLRPLRPSSSPFSRILVAAATPSPSSRSSFDDEDSLDADPSRELWRLDPAQARAQAARLDLLWSVGSKVNKP